MSDVSASDRANYSDEIRRMREEYQSREAENSKKTRNEKKRLQQNHNAELEKLKRQHEEQLNILTERQKNSLTSRDEAYQRDVSKLRNIYNDQLRLKSENSKMMQDEVARTHRDEIEKLKQTSEQQKGILKQNFNTVTEKQGDEIENIRTESQERIKKIIEEKSQALSDKLEKDRSLIRKERDEKVSELNKAGLASKAYYQSELEKSKKQKQIETERVRIRGESNLKNLSHQYDSMMKGRDEMLNEERRVMLNETQALRNKHQQQADQAIVTLRDNIEDRYNKHVRGIESELSRTKSDRIVDMVTQQRIQNLSRKHIVEDYENRMAKLQQNQMESRQDVLDKNRVKVDQALRMNDGIIRESNQRKRQEINLLKTQARDDRSGLENLMNQSIEHEKITADRRIDRILNSTKVQSDTEKKYFQNNLASMKESFSEKLQGQRETNLEELRNIQTRAEAKLRDMDKRYQERLDQTVRFYESQIQELKDKQSQEKIATNKTNEVKFKNLMKNQKDVQDSLVTKYENRMSQIYENNQKEIDRIERRYQEQMNALNQRLKWANRGKA